MPLVTGKTYVFYNHQGGTALDLDVGSHNVQGWTYHGGTNQQWKVINEGGPYWSIVNVQTGAFLDYQTPAQDGKRIICSAQPIKWSITPESGNEIYKISVWNSQECVDLADGGKSADGTAVELWTGWGDDNQKWEAQGV